MVRVVGASVFPKVSILGSRIANVEPHEAVGILETVANGGVAQGYVCLSNVHTTITGVFDSSYKQITNGAYMALPDGKPLVWALRLLDVGPSKRTNGPMLMERMLERAPQTGHRHFFFGGSENARDKLLSRYTTHNVVGCFSPPFREPTPEEDQEHADMINAAEPHFVWVGLGAPKQELWMHEHREALGVPLSIGIGASIDFEAGVQKRAPRWMQRSGFEWVYRLARDPVRMGKRYLGRDLPFVGYFFGLALRRCWPGGPKNRNGSQADSGSTRET